MKKVFLSMWVLAGLAMTACSGDATLEENKEAGEKVTYTIDSDATTLEWTGHYLIGGDVDHSHTGTLRVTEGTLTMNGDSFEDGKFTLDMTSLDEPNPMSEEMGQKFVGHMQSGDFFNTEKHPKATFTVTEMDDKRIKGTVSMLDSKMDVEFPVKVQKTENGLTANGSFTLDIAALKMPGMGIDPANPDQYISPSVDFKLNLVMKK